jgi:hypothetical protein
MAYSFTISLYESKRGQTKFITATNFVRIEGGPFWGFAAGRKFREILCRRENMHIMAERAMRRKRHRKRHNMYRTRCLNIQRHFSIITILFPALFISTVYVCHAITKSILDTIPQNNFKYINVYTNILLIDIIHAHYSLRSLL